MYRIPYKMLFDKILYLWRKDERKISSSFSEEAYKTLSLLVQGKFNVPVAERTHEQKNAVVRYCRNRDRFHLGPQATPTLYFDDKKVVSNIGSCLKNV